MRNQHFGIVKLVQMGGNGRLVLLRVRQEAGRRWQSGDFCSFPLRGWQSADVMTFGDAGGCWAGG